MTFPNMHTLVRRMENLSPGGWNGNRLSKNQLEVQPDLFWADFQTLANQVFGQGIYYPGAYGSDTTEVEIQAAIDAAEASTYGGMVLVPPGSWTISTSLTINSSNVWLVGCGRGITTLLCDTAMDEVVRVGVSSGTTITSHCGVARLTIDCAGGATRGLKLYNVQDCDFAELEVDDATSHGIETDCDSTLASAGNARVTLDNIYSHDNGGDGIRLASWREITGHRLWVYSNAGAGLSLEPFLKSDNSLGLSAGGHFETIRSMTNTADGIVMDGLERTVITDFGCDGNAGIGLRFSSSFDNSNAGPGNNALTLSQGYVNNCDGGALAVDEGAVVKDLSMSDVKLVGDIAGASDKHGLHLRGAQRCSFAAVTVEAATGCGIYIEDGTHQGSSAESKTLRFTDCVVRNCGKSGATTADGVCLVDATSDVIFKGIHLDNLLTTSAAGHSEVSIGASVTDVAFRDGEILATDGITQNWDVAAGALDEITMKGMRQGAGNYTPTVASEATITLPPCEMITVTGVTTITAINPLGDGQSVLFIFPSGLTLTDGATIKLGSSAGAGTFAVAAGAGVVGRCRASVWYFDV